MHARPNPLLLLLLLRFRVSSRGNCASLSRLRPTLTWLFKYVEDHIACHKIQVSQPCLQPSASILLPGQETLILNDVGGVYTRRVSTAHVSQQPHMLNQQEKLSHASMRLFLTFLQHRGPLSPAQRQQHVPSCCRHRPLVCTVN